MQFHKITSTANKNSVTKILIKVTLVFFIFFISIILVDKIDFPSPNKKIEKVISNENFKIIK